MSNEKFQNLLPIKTVVDGMTQGILAGSIAANTTAQKIPASPLADRKSIMIKNSSGVTAYIGGSTVTSAGSNGYPINNGETFAFDFSNEVEPYIVLSSGTGTIYYLQGG